MASQAKKAQPAKVKAKRKGEYLKARVHWRARAYFLVGLIAVVWLGLGRPTAPPDLKAISAPMWAVTAVGTVFSVLVVAINLLPGPDLKAILVFWRWRDPLPGSRAFEKASLERDTRIDRERLRGVVDGKFPRAAKDQNKTWYRLYQSVQSEPVIEEMQFEYLLYRDLAWASIVLGVLALASHVVSPPPFFGRGLLVPAGFAALYLIFRRAAAVQGQRFVNQVLVTVSVSAPLPSSKS